MIGETQLPTSRVFLNYCKINENKYGGAFIFPYDYKNYILCKIYLQICFLKLHKGKNIYIFLKVSNLLYIFCK